MNLITKFLTSKFSGYMSLFLVALTVAVMSYFSNIKQENSDLKIEISKLKLELSETESRYKSQVRELGGVISEYESQLSSYQQRSEQAMNEAERKIQELIEDRDAFNQKTTNSEELNEWLDSYLY